MKSNKLIKLTLFTAVLSTVTMYAQSEQLSAQGFIDSYMYKSEHNPDIIKVGLILKDFKDNDIALNEYTLKSNNSDILTKIEDTAQNHKAIIINYDDSTKKILDVVALTKQPEIQQSTKNYRHSLQLFKAYVKCVGGDIFGGQLRCYFTDNNGLKRRFKGTYGNAGVPGLGAFGGTISMDNLPKSDYISCNFNFQSYIFYLRVNLSCEGGKSGTINAGGLKGPGASWGTGVISDDI